MIANDRSEYKAGTEAYAIVNGVMSKLTVMREMFKGIGTTEATPNGPGFESDGGSFYFGLGDMCDEMVDQLLRIE